jgi:hypothetical protein
MDYAEPLPNFSRVALSGTFSLGGTECSLQISPIQRFPDYGPDYDVVHLQVLRDGVPLALADLSPRLEPARCYELWSDLCAALQEATVVVYQLAPPADDQPNPRLGCWGPRSDLVAGAQSDCATALVIGLAVDTRAAVRRPGSAVLAQHLASALLQALRRWEAAAAEV